MGYLNKIENLTDEEKVIMELIPPPTEKKKVDEINKKVQEEDFHMNNTYKRPFAGLYLYGTYFPNTQLLRVRFHFSKSLEFETIVFYKNQYKIACLIPGKMII
jgi:hypothetical protein